MKYYTIEEIAESLGVNVTSVQRWADSGKLSYASIDDGVQKFCSENLAEFASKYNISMRFLTEPIQRKRIEIA
ncbi:MAG: helix-turn-helix domain-containing protein [Bacteroidota bacterium]|nr:helix-turn-helix domain-containing protein [Bacteroidota bacterium]